MAATTFVTAGNGDSPPGRFPGVPPSELTRSDSLTSPGGDAIMRRPSATPDQILKAKRALLNTVPRDKSWENLDVEDDPEDAPNPMVSLARSLSNLLSERVGRARSHSDLRLDNNTRVQQKMTRARSQSSNAFWGVGQTVADVEVSRESRRDYGV